MGEGATGVAEKEVGVGECATASHGEQEMCAGSCRELHGPSSAADPCGVFWFSEETTVTPGRVDKLDEANR